ncbi:alpha/beta fold hydrolase [Sphingomonas sp. MMS24-J45]|uniref:alpha/beta fold hydrolase n=1 Tax=Sphingomonas sp. MMS24-J45 TaxID=3238806 RepID=UPI00384ED3AA
MSQTLCFLPGLLCDARVFSEQLRHFDGSSAIDGFGARTSLVDMARHILDSGPQRMALLGHSMGARVALEVYRLAPERVDRLALVSTGVHPLQPGEADKRHALQAIGEEQGVEALVDHWLPPMLSAAHPDYPAIIAPLRAMCIESGVAVYAAQITALIDRPEVETLLPTITCPVLVAVGSEDVWSPPAQHAAIAQAIQHATLTVVPGAGHMLPVEQPDALNAAIAVWLAQPTRH